MDIFRLYEAENSRELSEVRAIAAMVVQQIESITLTSLDKELGRDLSALSQSAERLRKRIKESKALQEKKERVEKTINTRIRQVCPGSYRHKIKDTLLPPA
ncbi:MAG: hypothetical protein R8K20_02620 [Gallionellaceae bacterium]